jgi:hypothetical protein
MVNEDSHVPKSLIPEVLHERIQTLDVLLYRAVCVREDVIF